MVTLFVCFDPISLDILFKNTLEHMRIAQSQNRRVSHVQNTLVHRPHVQAAGPITDQALDRRSACVHTLLLWSSVSNVLNVSASAAETSTYRAQTVLELLECVSNAPDGAIIELAPDNEYILNDTLEVKKSMSIRNGTIKLSTEDPYKPVIRVQSASEVRLDSLALRHRSPSIANNYAIHVIDCTNCTLHNLDVVSSTGTGICIEAGHSILIQDCHVHDCAGNGIAIFTSVDGLEDNSDQASSDTILIRGTTIEGNSKAGLLVSERQGIVLDGACSVNNIVLRNGATLLLPNKFNSTNISTDAYSTVTYDG